jgi:2,5-diamino-6-(ribosylamino)-4(3H)-pyrimidinone 5'-phosphate reductase
LTGKATRLYPLPPREIPAGKIYEDLELPSPGRHDPSRPYVIVNMVASIDGKTAVYGRSSQIGSRTDRQTMRNLRSKADAVMIGAGTLRSERLSLGLDDAPLGPQPLAVIATNTGDAPLERNLIVAESQEVLVITTQHARANLDNQLGERARVFRMAATPSGDVDLREALQILKTDHAVDLLLVEGGPSLNHALISCNLADEFFLTLAPRLIGGTTSEARTTLDGTPLDSRTASLLSIHHAAGELFVRYDL